MTAHPRARLLAFTASLVFAIGACGGDDDSADFDPAIDSPRTTARVVTTTVPTGPTTTSASSVVAVTVRGGSVEGPSRHRVNVDREVTIRVTSDVADEVHVHGYDLTVPVGPGQPGELTFAANIHGVFEVELERSRRRLFTLEVQT